MAKLYEKRKYAKENTINYSDLIKYIISYFNFLLFHTSLY